jgi:Flp pilus assembly protein TadB
MRSRLRIVVFGVVIIVIGLASIVESPGTAEAVVFAVVLVTLLLRIVRERRNPS